MSQDDLLPKILNGLGEQAAQVASTQLATQTFGAVSSIKFVRAEISGQGDNEHYILRFEARAMGEKGQAVAMVLLPEFLDVDDEGLEELCEQVAIYITEEALARFKMA